MADKEQSRGRKGRAQSTFWRGFSKRRQSQHNGRRKQSQELAGIATLRPLPSVNDNLLQTIPESSFIAENPYAETANEELGTESTEQGPEGGIDILSVDGPNEQDNSILLEEYSQSKLIAKAAKILTIIFLFTAILVCATISKLCFVAITTQMHHALALNFSTQPANDSFSDMLQDTVQFNDMSELGTEATNSSVLQSLNNTSDASEEQPTTADSTSGGPQRITKKQQSIVFIQVVIVLMSPQLVTFVRMLFGGIIGKSSSTYPWPSIGAMVVVRLHTHVHTHTHTHTHKHCTHTHACTHEYTHARTHTHTHTQPCNCKFGN